MGKIKSLLKKLSDNFRHVTACYPITIILVYAVSIVISVFIDQSSSLGHFMEDYGIPFLLLWTVGSWFSETCLKKNPGKLIGFAAAGLAAAFFVYFGNNGTPEFKEIITRWQAAYVIVLFLTGIYKNYRDSELPFERYCAIITFEFSKLAIICGVVGMGIALVTATFTALLLNGEHYMLIIRAEFLVLGCISGTGFLKAMVKPDQDISRFFTVIFKYLLMTLLTAAYVIIYAYMLKIALARVVPSNEIFRILAGLFLIGLPIWTITGSFDEDTWSVRTAKKLPYIFIPFLPLQGYAIRERIMAYGLTPFRCLCLALMLFEIIYIIIFFLRHRDTSMMLLTAAVLTVICLVLPGINIFSLSNRSQKKIFDKYFQEDFASLPAEDQSSLAGAYYYLTGNEEGKKMLEAADPAKINEIVESGKIGDPDYDRNLYLFFDFPVLDENIEDFQKMTIVTSEDPEYKETLYDPGAIKFYTEAGSYLLSADLSTFINSCIAANQASSFDIQDLPYVIDLGNGKVLRVTSCIGTIQPDKTIQYLNINAILFEQDQKNDID